MLGHGTGIDQLSSWSPVSFAMNIRIVGGGKTKIWNQNLKWVRQELVLASDGYAMVIRWLCHGHQNHGDILQKCWRWAVFENKIRIAGGRNPSRKIFWSVENLGNFSVSLNYCRIWAIAPLTTVESGQFLHFVRLLSNLGNSSASLDYSFMYSSA